mgnify:CR=1 FL=1
MEGGILLIQNYLISNCLLIIEELNQRFERYQKDEILKFANIEFNESDLVFLMAYPFRNLMKVSMQGKNEDIIIKKLDFIIELSIYMQPRTQLDNTLIREHLKRYLRRIFLG